MDGKLIEKKEKFVSQCLITMGDINPAAYTCVALTLPGFPLPNLTCPK